jgi:hypothetical protein
VHPHNASAPTLPPALPPTTEPETAYEDSADEDRLRVAPTTKPAAPTTKPEAPTTKPAVPTTKPVDIVTKPPITAASDGSSGAGADTGPGPTLPPGILNEKDAPMSTGAGGVDPAVAAVQSNKSSSSDVCTERRMYVVCYVDMHRSIARLTLHK